MGAEKFWEISRGIFQALWLILYWYYCGYLNSRKAEDYLLQSLSSVLQESQ